QLPISTRRLYGGITTANASSVQPSHGRATGRLDHGEYRIQSVMRYSICDRRRAATVSRGTEWGAGIGVVYMLVHPLCGCGVAACEAADAPRACHPTGRS